MVTKVARPGEGAPARRRTTMAALFLLPLMLPAADAGTADPITLPVRLCRIEYFQGTLYGAPCVGTSIFRFIGSGRIDPISFTDDVNYRVRGFKPTPFALYINRGPSIEKYYPASGARESVWAAGDITAFDLTDADEVILADRQARELIFLDFAFQKKHVIPDIACEDLQWHDGRLYALTRNRIHVYDEHGNLLETMQVPERADRLRVAAGDLLVFSERARYIFRGGPAWSRIALPFAVLDICARDDGFLILDGIGTTVHIYPRGDL